MCRIRIDCLMCAVFSLTVLYVPNSHCLCQVCRIRRVRQVDLAEANPAVRGGGKQPAALTVLYVPGSVDSGEEVHLADLDGRLICTEDPSKT